MRSAKSFPRIRLSTAQRPKKNNKKYTTPTHSLLFHHAYPHPCRRHPKPSPGGVHTQFVCRAHVIKNIRANRHRPASRLPLLLLLSTLTSHIPTAVLLSHESKSTNRVFAAAETRECSSIIDPESITRDSATKLRCATRVSLAFELLKQGRNEGRHT